MKNTMKTAALDAYVADLGDDENGDLQSMIDSDAINLFGHTTEARQWLAMDVKDAQDAIDAHVAQAVRS